MVIIDILEHLNNAEDYKVNMLPQIQYTHMCVLSCVCGHVVMLQVVTATNVKTVKML